MSGGERGEAAGPADVSGGRDGRRARACRARDHPRPALGQHPARPARRSRALDTPAVQRLRYIRQLGHAFLVYPGATHTRFEHALGAYHLDPAGARARSRSAGELGPVIAEEDCLAVRLAALLHDIGHYPFSHALEEAGLPSHETLGVAKLRQGELGERLARDRRRRTSPTRSGR